MRKSMAVLAFVALAGCASTNDSLQRATAMSIGGNSVAPDEIVIANVQRGMMDVSWTASVGTAQYACSADDMVRRPHCRRGK
jgi:hypothetical protein